MKTVRELYHEVMNSDELKAQFIEAASAGKQEDFLKEHGCEATLEEVAGFLKAKSEEDTSLSMDELENSAGGKCNKYTMVESFTSVMSAGIACAILSVTSAAIGHVGQKNDDEARTCNEIFKK